MSLNNLQSLDLDALKLIVKELFEQKLSPTMLFHNYEHTLLVYKAVNEIGINANLTDSELKVLQVSALFHDTGYTEKYFGHEDASIEIVKDYLEKFGADLQFIESVQACIFATKYPQVPTSKLEQIICDADFYHFSLPNYLSFAKALKEEWAVHICVDYTEESWNRLNLEMLQKHQYFTDYGQNVLQSKKEENIRTLVNFVT
ncbi:HD domain-containing protein [Pedobacter fastidiosus]|uniref:HD domain-containing protein n=1 Tax=Pedobacter fastidiosus TaxID=2765361 RepID=A0ABR7KR44_9SPHI|nr:HD domain-containing protein [Pedobacter fastidiosus]MBC6110530.1 HD domain-containing protein [Pedobacter fastidiosus]